MFKEAKGQMKAGVRSKDFTMNCSVGANPLHFYDFLCVGSGLFTLQRSQVSTFIQHPADVGAHQTAIVF